jgi:hypothetical protein
MKKIIIATLSFVATFALVASLAGISSAQASVLGSPTPVYSTHWTTNALDEEKSDTLNWGSKGTKRWVTVDVTNNGPSDINFTADALTGSGSYDDYFDCGGYQVFSQFDACTHDLASHQSTSFVVGLDDSSWWKDTDGVYLQSNWNDFDMNGLVSYDFRPMS